MIELEKIDGGSVVLSFDKEDALKMARACMIAKNCEMGFDPEIDEEEKYNDGAVERASYFAAMELAFQMMFCAGVNNSRLLVQAVDECVKQFASCGLPVA